MTLTPTEQDELRIAIAEEMGWKGPRHPDNIAGMEGWWSQNRGVWWINPIGERVMISSVPPYTTSIDAIQAAALERFERYIDIIYFNESLNQLARDKEKAVWQWQLTAIDWCIAFARTAKIWRYKV